MISIVAAVADNGAIGKNNQLLWHITEDMRYFRKLTSGHTVIMGRKTWESIGKPLPNRRNIVVSSSLFADPSQPLKGKAEVYKSLGEALEAARNNPPVSNPSRYHLSRDYNDASANLHEVFIIGGGEIYRQAIPLADKLYLTRVHIMPDEADTFFPKLDFSKWREVSRNYFPRGEFFEYPFEFVVLVRR
ncbi:MAG: dihydrofolate reductase [Bacteroidales bacterium]|jgi:dihydrofolate reductase|nr:dihydrofolate reductase [Bacteroidales bacterium]MDD2424799.1 dihydrofolate reductase [Bacteroidales bacterium]MDD3989944.1 dihydrofolate reductase [Bacteroidales bacterium]MDD4638482.1 dihydrofolate reductase [Bacteroidales bacterium]